MSLSPAPLENSRDPDVAQELARHKDLRTTQPYLRARRTRVWSAAGPPQSEVTLNSRHGTAMKERRNGRRQQRGLDGFGQIRLKPRVECVRFAVSVDVGTQGCCG